MSKPLTVADLRASMGISLAQMAETLGLTSRGHLSDIERGKTPPSLSVALAIESLSDGRIDAAALNADVAAARAGFVRDGDSAKHGATGAAAHPVHAMGQAGAPSPCPAQGQGARGGGDNHGL